VEARIGSAIGAAVTVQGVVGAPSNGPAQGSNA
jgi:hypothetical protein